jgi:hypothetical protein
VGDGAGTGRLIEIHQALHGYSDGHRLLAASCRLPREAQRALLIVSDISGPVTAGMFDSYLTGCPLPGAGAYALSRTWLATELTRPGCVWTHTLLVEYADLARLPDLAALVPLFRRPRRGEARQEYSRAATLPPAPGDAAPARVPLPERDLNRVLAAFYGVPELPTFLVADRADRLESLVLALWSQQWPRLRRSLSFCTWALTIRSVEGEPVDLQVVPPTVYRQLRERQPKSVSVNLGSRLTQEAEPVPIPGWAPAAARDLLGESGDGFRQFLWRFGPEMPLGRPAFAPLAEIGSQVEMVREGRLPVAELVQAVTARYPGSAEGQRLKLALFGEQARDPDAPLPALRESEVIEALATASRPSALDAESLALGRRATALWNTERGAALALAGRLAGGGTLTPLGEELLGAVATAISPADAAGLMERHPRLFATLVARNAALARPAVAPPPTPAPPAPTPPLAAPPLPVAPAPLAAPPPLPVAAPPPVSEARPRAPQRVAPPVPALEDPPALPAPAPVAPPPVAPPPPPPPPSPGPAPDTLPRRPQPTTAGEILDWLNDSAADQGLRQPPAGWQSVLESRPSQVLGWILSTEAPALPALAAAVSVLDPSSAEVKRAGASPWLRALATLESPPDEPGYEELMAFLLALAFHDQGPGAPDLAVRAFDPVDRALAGQTLSPAAWERLARDLPSMPWWREWDRPERLRRGFVERCVRHRWPPDMLLRATLDDETFQRLVVICEWTRDGQDLLKRLGTQVGQGKVPATTPRRSILATYIRGG